MFALLGDVQFDLITYFDGFESQFGVDYAEHALIDGKPRLQRVGDKLDEIRIQLSFHSQFCDPEQELIKLQTALRAHQAMALVLGNGDYKGWFVLTELQATSRQTDQAGTLIALEASLTLREFVGDKKNPLAPPAVQAKLPPAAATALPASMAAKAAGLQAGVGGAIGAVRDGVRQVVTYANQAQSAMRAAEDATRVAQKLRDNPLAALGQVPGLQGTMKQVAGPLERLSPVLNILSSQLPDAGGILRAGNTALDAVRNAQGALSAVTAGNVVGRIDSMAGQLAAASSALESVAPNISKLAGKVITRAI
ncbi:phage protein U [Chromobacterium alkanivorans]|uniref:phage tail protein n=1 Tax=Chromobacterium alkanivorans TaxID=1071719 RepID=UPI0021674919|nr:phage tail protein [Chromobacterium alkanivorans]MCS3806692.1 phage protein U [Chromobacterium alkanivorans]MCS3821136.1 phage protein U [Chromobacterium alkanivorans]MCS3875952.1 phage protein U [Chromobacterium alkanivorans]